MPGVSRGELGADRNGARTDNQISKRTRNPNISLDFPGKDSKVSAKRQNSKSVNEFFEKLNSSAFIIAFYELVLTLRVCCMIVCLVQYAYAQLVRR